VRNQSFPQALDDHLGFFLADALYDALPGQDELFGPHMALRFLAEGHSHILEDGVQRETESAPYLRRLDRACVEANDPPNR
jgi:hypothetical protein